MIMDSRFQAGSLFVYNEKKKFLRAITISRDMHLRNILQAERSSCGNKDIQGHSIYRKRSTEYVE